MFISVVPLSVNAAWQGRRFKTPKYTSYEKEMLSKLKPITLPDAPYELFVKVSFSNKASDIDNILKPLIDILQKKYEINDKDIYKLVVEKIIVQKGKEGIYLKFSHYPYA